ncbi:hypothetical protein MRX96_029209 [Rhipicephalus microplus]
MSRTTGSSKNPEGPETPAPYQRPPLPCTQAPKRRMTRAILVQMATWTSQAVMNPALRNPPATPRICRNRQARNKRDLRAQVRDEQREKIALEERRLQSEERVLLLKLKLQEQKTGSNAGEIGRPPRSNSRPGHVSSGSTRFCSRTPTTSNSKKPTLSWADKPRVKT